MDTRSIPGLENSRPGALLAYLAMETGGLVARPPVGRQELAELFWPDCCQPEALSKLRFALAKLRAALGERYSFLLVDRHHIGLDPRADVWVDVVAFQQQAAACEVQVQSGQPPDLETLQAALRLYRGRFLQELSTDGSLGLESWMRARRELLERQYLYLLHLLASSCEQGGQYGQAEEAYLAILARQPEDEAAQHGLWRLSEGIRQRVIKGREQTEAGGASPAIDPAAWRSGTPFVARQRELAGLEAALEAVLYGQGRLVLVSGEAGSGKTALLSEFARRAAARYPDLLVVGGRCNAYSGLGQPYLPFIECVQMLAGEWDTLPWATSLGQEQQAHLQSALPWAARILVETTPALLDRFVGRVMLAERLLRLPGSQPTWLARLRQERREAGRSDQPLEAGVLFAQITRLLMAVARHSPVVLLLDDLQWIDPGSAALLFHLVRRCPASRVLIMAAYRSSEVLASTAADEHPLQGVAAELRGLPGSVLIDLEQADEQAFVAAYLEKDPFLQPHRLDKSFCLALARHTGGHPLFLSELLRYLQAHGDLQRSGDGAWVTNPGLSWQRLPERIEAVIAGRMRRLPAQWVDWLHTASVEGESFTAEVLAQVHGVDENMVLRDLNS